MYPFHYDVSLRLRHPTVTPDEITKALGIQPRHTQKVSEPRTTPAGTPLKGFYKNSCWSANLSSDKPQKSAQAEFEECLSRIVEQLALTKDFMRAFVESGGETELFVGLYCPQNSGMVFSWSLLARLASLRIGLSLDYYPGDPNSTS